MLTLNFQHSFNTLDEDSEPAAGDFTVTVAGSAWASAAST